MLSAFDPGHGGACSVGHPASIAATVIDTREATKIPNRLVPQHPGIGRIRSGHFSVSAAFSQPVTWRKLTRKFLVDFCFQ